MLGSVPGTVRIHEVTGIALPSVILPSLGKETHLWLYTRTLTWQKLPAGTHTYLRVQRLMLTLPYTPVHTHMATQSPIQM